MPFFNFIFLIYRLVSSHFNVRLFHLASFFHVVVLRQIVLENSRTLLQVHQMWFSVFLRVVTCYQMWNLAIDTLCSNGTMRYSHLPNKDLRLWSFTTETLLYKWRLIRDLLWWWRAVSRKRKWFYRLRNIVVTKSQKWRRRALDERNLF